MATSRHEGDFHVAGTLTAATFTPPSSSVVDASIASGSNVDADKLQHRFRRMLCQVHGSAATAERRVIYRAFTTGTIVRVNAGSVVACVGDSTITIDVKKNGTTVLSATMVLNNANTAYITEDGTLSVTTLVAGDVLEVVQTVSAGTGTLGQGVFVTVDIDENAA